MICVRSYSMPYPKHVLQSSLWAEFREKWGTKVIRVGNAQFTVHKVPLLKWTIGYMPRPLPQDIDWKILSEKARENKCIFVKIEPNSDTFSPPQGYNVKKGERIFAYATFLVDLHKSEEELLKAMNIKTRYNVNLARRKSVVIKHGTDEGMLQEFLEIHRQTARRHNILLHPDSYYKKLFEVFKNQKQAEILTAYYNNTPLASMMVLIYKDTAFYPYGGSLDLHREAKPFYLLMWEAFKLAKEKSCKYFDQWNCLLPEDERLTHPWYGFHYFKKGFGGDLVRFCGAYDVVFNPLLYYIFVLANKPRPAILKLISTLKK